MIAIQSDTRDAVESPGSDSEDAPAGGEAAPADSVGAAVRASDSVGADVRVSDRVRAAADAARAAAPAPSGLRALIQAPPGEVDAMRAAVLAAADAGLDEPAIAACLEVVERGLAQMSGTDLLAVGRRRDRAIVEHWLRAGHPERAVSHIERFSRVRGWAAWAWVALLLGGTAAALLLR